MQCEILMNVQQQEHKIIEVTTLTYNQELVDIVRDARNNRQKAVSFDVADLWEQTTRTSKPKTFDVNYNL